MTITDTLPAQRTNLATQQPLTSDAPAPGDGTTGRNNGRQVSRDAAANPYKSPEVKAALANGTTIHSKPEPLTTALAIVEPNIAPDRPGYLKAADGYVEPHALPEQTDHVIAVHYTVNGVGTVLYVAVMQHEPTNKTANFLPTDEVLLAALGTSLGTQEQRRVDWLLTWKRVKGRAIAVKVIPQENPMAKKTTNADDYAVPSGENPMEAQIAANAAEVARANAAADAKAAEPHKPSEWDEHNAALNEQAAAEENPDCAPWINDDKQRGKFFAEWTSLYGERVAKCNAPANGMDAYRKKWLYVRTQETTLKKWKFGADVLLESLRKALDIDYPLPAPETTVATTNGAAKDVTPAAAATERQAGDISRVEPDTPSKDDKQVQTEPTTVDKTTMLIPFSSKFHMLNQKGVSVEFTISALAASDIVTRTETMIDALLAKGWTTTRTDSIQAMPVDVPALATTPVTTGADSGTSECFMIAVGKSFKGDKDQIVFTLNGVDDAKYSSKEQSALIKIVSGLRKPDGSAIAAGDLVNGVKLPVRGLVDWKKSDDGKWINVLGTRAA